MANYTIKDIEEVSREEITDSKGNYNVKYFARLQSGKVEVTFRNYVFYNKLFSKRKDLKTTDPNYMEAGL